MGSLLSPGTVETVGSMYTLSSSVETGQPAGMFPLIAATSAGSVVLSCNCKRRRSKLIINCKCTSELILNQTKQS